ncbi:MAG: DNA recombination protein RmuC [candidate division Zixibacteria bacterium]|nr:DNA recombination protein RmuC [candidate division Zixibacteria bacterium]
MDWLLLLLGILIGAVAAWFLGRAQAKGALDIVKQQIEQKDRDFIELRRLYEAESRSNTEAQTQLIAARESIAAQQKFVDESKKQLEDAFASLSRTALTGNSKEFLELAKSELGTVLATAEGKIDQKQQAIGNLVQPLTDALSRYEQQTRALESTLKQDYGSVRTELKTVASTSVQLQRETANLVQALRNPRVRGRWGETTLRNAAEISGMSDHCDFTEQQTINAGEGKQRPDMTVHFPGGLKIIVDAKVPLEAYLDGLSSTNDDERANNFRRHAVNLRDHVKKLSDKAYWAADVPTPDFVVMFIPGDSFLSVAADIDRNLFDDGWRRNVFVTTPTTLIALLRTAALGWRQENLAKNAQDIRHHGEELYKRISTFVDNFKGVGKSLGQAVTSYNDSVGSLEGGVLISARKFKELGATARADLPEVSPIDRLPRTLQTDLLPGANVNHEKAD